MGRPTQDRFDAHGVNLVKYSPSGDVIWHRDTFHHAQLDPQNSQKEVYEYLHHSGLPRNFDIAYRGDITDDINFPIIRQNDTGNLSTLVPYQTKYRSGIYPHNVYSAKIDYDNDRLFITNTVDNDGQSYSSGIFFDKYGNRLRENYNLQVQQGTILYSINNKLSPIIDSSGNLNLPNVYTDILPINLDSNLGVPVILSYINKFSQSSGLIGRLLYSTYNGTEGIFGDNITDIYMIGNPVAKWEVISSGGHLPYEGKLRIIDDDIFSISGKLIFDVQSGINHQYVIVPTGPNTTVTTFNNRFDQHTFSSGNIIVSLLGATIFDGLKFTATNQLNTQSFALLPVHAKAYLEGITEKGTYISRLTDDFNLVSQYRDEGISGYNLYVDNSYIYFYKNQISYPKKQYAKYDFNYNLINSGEYNLYWDTLPSLVSNNYNRLITTIGNDVYYGGLGLTKFDSTGAVIWHKSNKNYVATTKSKNNIICVGNQNGYYLSVLSSASGKRVDEYENANNMGLLGYYMTQTIGNSYKLQIPHLPFIQSGKLRFTIQSQTNAANDLIYGQGAFDDGTTITNYGSFEESVFNITPDYITNQIAAIIPNDVIYAFSGGVLTESRIEGYILDGNPKYTATLPRGSDTLSMDIYENFTITITEIETISGICSCIDWYDSNGNMILNKPYDLIVTPFNHGIVSKDEHGLLDVDADLDGNIYCVGNYLNKHVLVNPSGYKFNG